MPILATRTKIENNRLTLFFKASLVLLLQAKAIFFSTKGKLQVLDNVFTVKLNSTYVCTYYRQNRSPAFKFNRRVCPNHNSKHIKYKRPFFLQKLKKIYVKLRKTAVNIGFNLNINIKWLYYISCMFCNHTRPY